MYAAKNTQLILKDDTLAEAEIIGAETEGDFVFVYQEVLNQPSALKKIQASIFMDINAGQINRINILHSGNIASLKFFAGETAKDLTSS